MTQTQTDTRNITLTQALNEAMREEMRRDERVFIMGEDIQSGVYGASGGLFAEFGGERVRDCPLSENAFMGAAVGAAAVASATAELAGAPGFIARHGERLARLPGVSAFELNERAWIIAISPKATDDELKAALLLAERAVLETDRSVAAVLDTLAEVEFLLGWPDRAMATIDEAIAREPGESYYQEQRKRFAGERAADDRPEGPTFLPAPPPDPEPRLPTEPPGLTV